MNNKQKHIDIDYNGKKYKLCFTASSLKAMERQGFNFGKMDEKLLTVSEELFIGSFIANHPTTPRAERVKIYNEICAESEDGESLTDVLAEMLTETIEEINAKKGNVKWSVTR